MNKILVVAPSWVGDTVLMQPMLMRLKQRHPEALIDVLAPLWTAMVAREMPEVHGVIVSPFSHGALKLHARYRLGKELSDSGYDQAIVLPNSFKSALVPFFAGIPLRTGFTGEMRYGLLNDERKLDRRILPLMVERFTQLAEAPGDSILHPLPYPKLNVSGEQRKSLFDKLGLSGDKPVAIFCIGAEYGPAKRWPIPYFAELAQILRERGYTVWLVGGEKDKEAGDKIIALGNEACRNLCGMTYLSEAIVLLSAASLVVSNDSGLMHLAAALNRPMLALYGSSSPQFTPPLSSKARVVKLDLPCSPCYKRECPYGHFNCMMQLTPQKVAQHLSELPAA